MTGLAMRVRMPGIAFVCGLFLFVAACAPLGAHAATPVIADITTDTTWSAEDSPFVVSDLVRIAKGVTLTIEPGVFVKSEPGVTFTVEGVLEASGTSGSPITFTSSTDDSDGNDTNGDGSATEAGTAPWGTVMIAPGGEALFSHTKLIYGGAYPPGGPRGDFIPPLPGVIINRGTLSMTDSTIENTALSGGIDSEGMLTFVRSAVREPYTGVAISASGTERIEQSAFAARETLSFGAGDITLSHVQSADAIEVRGGGAVFHNGGGNDAVIPLVWNDLGDTDTTLPTLPFVNVLSGISVPSGGTLTIPAGAVVKSYDPIDVYGTLLVGSVASGAATTTLTSRADDAVGGDTNSEEGEVSAGPGDWGGIVAEEGSVVRISHAAVLYAGDSYGSYLASACGDGSDEAEKECAGQILNEGGTVTVASSTFSRALFNDVAQDAGTTTVTGSRFLGSPSFARVRGGALMASGNSIADTSGITASTDSGAAADARENWWGDVSGPHNADTNPSGVGPDISANVLFDPWLSSDPFAPLPPDPCSGTTCVDSVLFLPGIEGSRLYEGTGCGGSSEEKLWEPLASVFKLLLGAGDAKVKKLALDSGGASACSDVYAKENDIIDTVRGGDIYQPFIDEMNGLVASTTIAMGAWKPVAYDWRLSLDDLLANGAETGGKIYYEQATDTPYIEQTLRGLAAGSKTGKVTIVAHSNGGLVAKALLQKLGNAETSALVDKLVLVGAPQSGAPEDVGSLLVGYNAGIYKYDVSVVSNAVARAFAQNSPMAYHLLPSSAYLSSTIDDPTHPVVHFSGSAYEKQRTAYGNSLVTKSALDDFLLATAGDRIQASDSDLLDAKILNPLLLTYANTTHDALDSWVPPASIEVDQIAGWGNDTVAGIDFYTNSRSAASALSSATELPEYRPIFIEDGDGTVPVPSALLMSTSSPNVKRYWVDLYDFNRYQTTGDKYTHANIFGVAPIQSLLENLLATSTFDLPQYVSSERPPVHDPAKKLIFTLHSPLTLQISDSFGNTTGLSSDGSVRQDIPGAEYGQFGETQYIIAPQGTQYQVTLHGQSSGTFSLDAQEYSGGTVSNTTSVTGVPTTASTTATLSVQSDLSTLSNLSVDENGDGKSIITITPKSGDTVAYTPPADPVSESGSSDVAPARAAGGPGYNPYQSIESITLPVVVPIFSVPSTTVPVVEKPQAPVAATSTALSTSTTPLLSVTNAVKTQAPQAADVAQGDAVERVASVSPALPPQTASVYDAASQQSLLSGIARAFYTGVHSVWNFLVRLL